MTRRPSARASAKRRGTKAKPAQVPRKLSSTLVISAVQKRSPAIQNISPASLSCQTGRPDFAVSLGVMRAGSDNRRLGCGAQFSFGHAVCDFDNLQSALDHVQNTQIGDDPVHDGLTR